MSYPHIVQSFLTKTEAELEYLYDNHNILGVVQCE